MRYKFGTYKNSVRDERCVFFSNPKFYFKSFFLKFVNQYSEITDLNSTDFKLNHCN